jgi:AhpD family alkylhydroperoxidase
MEGSAGSSGADAFPSEMVLSRFAKWSLSPQDSRGTDLGEACRRGTGDASAQHLRGGQMQPRLDFARAAQKPYEALVDLERYFKECSLELGLIDLVKLRASQATGCAFWIDMHWKDARARGENEQRFYGLDAWREAPYYSDRERAELEWTEAVTRVADTHVPDSVYSNARRQFSEKELVDLTYVIAAINATPLLAVTMSTLFEAKTWNIVSVSGIALVLVGQRLLLRAQEASPERSEEKHAFPTSLVNRT